MDLKQIEKLMIAMGRNSMKRVAIKREGLELELERDTGPIHNPEQPVFCDHRLFAGFAQERSIPVDHNNGALNKDTPVEQPRMEAAADFISSPLVGTFYCSPSPEAAPFVKVGDTVSEETVVCIVEAMKVMNEVKAGMAGRIIEVLMTNGDPVQFGSKLFRIVKA